MEFIRFSKRIGVSMVIMLWATSCSVNRIVSESSKEVQYPIDLELVINLSYLNNYNFSENKFLHLSRSLDAYEVIHTESKQMIVLSHHCNSQQQANELIENISDTGMLISYRVKSCNKNN